MTCPDCEYGFEQALVHGQLRKLVCQRCDGTRQVPDSMATWIELGKLLKERRMKPYRPVYKEAKRLGVSSVDLSNAEAGRVDPTPYLAMPGE